MTANSLTDTHAHLCDPVFDPDRPLVLARARDAGVGAIIAVAEDLADARKNLTLAKTDPMIKAAAGLYPAHADPDRAAEMAAFIRANRQHLAAIGEVGLDFWIAKEEAGRERQKAVLKIFVQLSRELDLPLNIHSRSAGRHTVALLLENNAEKVQMHAFDGKIGAARPAVEAGYFFSIPPSVARSRQKQKLVRHLPLSCLLVETDSPVLGPEPGQRNEPANLIRAVTAIARIKEIPEAAVTAAVVENTEKLYGKF